VKPGIRIIGVVEEISVVPVQKENFPLIIQCNPQLCNEILVSTRKEDEKTIKYISRVYESIHGKVPQLTFYEEHLNSLYKEENFMLKYVVTFSTFTLSLVFLGFYFYSRSVVALRSKDIVIRKIHGASFQDIVKLLIKEYLKVFIISIIIAWLLFSYITNIWLSGFTLHIDKSLKFYLYPTIIVLTILLIAVVHSILKLAHKNIVATINNEN